MDDGEIVALAEALLDESKFGRAAEILSPLLERENAAALFLAGTFSDPENESEEEFDRRRLDYWQRAAKSGYPPALYALGVCYDTGDLVVVDADKAGRLFKLAAEANYSKGKFCHGRNLFYGEGGMVGDPEQGLYLIREAAREGVEDAEDFLDRL